METVDQAPRADVLFQIHNRRGLGHLMRSLNIAREIRALDPAVGLAFHTRAEPPAPLRHPGILWLVERDIAWAEALRALAPRVVVYDTILPDDHRAEPVPGGTRVAYVMRRAREEHQRRVFGHPWLERADLILVPHHHAEFGHELPESLAEKTAFVGPIVRQPDPCIQARLRERYRIGPEHFVVTSTVGGGGFADPARAFFEAVFAIHRRLMTSVRDLRHIAVRGPNLRLSLEALAGLTLVDVEADLIDLLAVSTLAVAEGGYNTVNEVRLTRTPAVFLPSHRSVDDQEERVRALERRGLACVLTDLGPEEIATRVEALCLSPTALPAMRRRYADDRMTLGNREAAERIVALLP